MHLGQEKRKAVNVDEEEEELEEETHPMAAPQVKPAWMDEHAQSTARATLLLMEDRFSKIECNQQAAALQQSTLALAVNRQGQEQTRMQAVLDEVVRKQALFDGCGSVGSGSASSGGSTRVPRTNLLAGFASSPEVKPSGNPYGAGAAVVDKSLVIVGGWRDNSPREVLVNDMNRFLIAYNLSGHTSVLAEVRCPSRAKLASVTFAESAADGTAVKQAWNFTGWMRGLPTASKPSCTGGAAAWSVINQSADDRLKSRCIKRGLRALHLLREEAGVAATVTELGVEVPLVEGRFKGKEPGVFLGGKRVAHHDEVKDSLEWNFRELKDSSLGVNQLDLEAKMGEMIGVPS